MGKAQASDRAGADLHDDADRPPATDREFPHPLRSRVEYDGVDRDQRRREPHPQSDADQLEAATDQAIAACGGDAREAVMALIIANQLLETDLEKLRAAVSMGFARGKLSETAKTLPRDRKDWYDQGVAPTNVRC
jgi:hypothetical protein